MDDLGIEKKRFWDNWKGRVMLVLSLLAAFFMVRYVYTFSPILSTSVWPEDDNVVIFVADIHTSPLTSKRGIYFLDLDSRRLRYWKSIDSNLSSYYFDSWAAQKQQILVHSGHGNFLVDTNGDIAKEIEFIGTPHISPGLSRYHSTISPNAESMAVIEFNEEGDIWNFYIQDINGTIQQNLQTGNFAYRFPTWSPDGQKLMFVRYRQNISSIVKTDIDGNNQEIIFSSQKGIGWSLAWSPDGKMIAFTERVESLQDSLWVMNADGSNSRIILSPELEWDDVYEMAWTPDNQHIVFFSKRGGHCRRDFVYRNLNCTSSLYMIDVNTSEVSRLTHHRLGYSFFDMLEVN